MNRLLQLLDQPFDLINPVKNRLFLAIFCGGFATLFLYIFNPFNSLSWQYDTSMARYLGIISSGLLAIPVLLFSQIIIRKAIFPRLFKFKHFFLQIGIELFLLSLVFFFIFGDQNPLGWSYAKEFLGVVKHTLQLAALPYFIGLLMLQVVTQKKELPDTPNVLEAVQPIWVNITDEKDKLILKLNIEHLLFFKSEDNYTAVHYLHNGQVQKSLVRTNLKKLGRELFDFPILRVHRSYMVNTKQLVSVAKEGKGYQLTLSNYKDQTIPVSESYKTVFDSELTPSNKVGGKKPF